MIIPTMPVKISMVARKCAGNGLGKTVSCFEDIIASEAYSTTSRGSKDVQDAGSVEF